MTTVIDSGQDLIRADGVTKRYGGRGAATTALDGVSIGFARGSFTAVMGPSGSGKSSLLHCAATRPAYHPPPARRVRRFLPRAGLLGAAGHRVRRLAGDRVARRRAAATPALGADSHHRLAELLHGAPHRAGPARRVPGGRGRGRARCRAHRRGRVLPGHAAARWAARHRGPRLVLRAAHALPARRGPGSQGRRRCRARPGPGPSAGRPGRRRRAGTGERHVAGTAGRGNRRREDRPGSDIVRNRCAGRVAAQPARPDRRLGRLPGGFDRDGHARRPALGRAARPRRDRADRRSARAG